MSDDDTSGLRCIDHGTDQWYLLTQHGDDLLVAARYTYSAAMDDSVLVRLDDAERRAFAEGGHDAITRLARRIHDSVPFRPPSPYAPRDLQRGAHGAAWRAAAHAAIMAYVRRRDAQPKDVAGA